MTRFIIAALILCLSASVANAAGWCGRYARTLAPSDPGPAYNLACNWRHYGSPTTAHVGAFVVWCSRRHHHVGKITAIDANGNVTVLSGNDGHRVRERVRSVAGAEFRQ